MFVCTTEYINLYYFFYVGILFIINKCTYMNIFIIYIYIHEAYIECAK